MATIYFVRHGEYKNPDNIVPWRLPYFPLSDKGIKNIKKDAEYFVDKNIDGIYSSPILRAKQSAKIIADKLNKKVIYSSLISEVFTPLQFRRISYPEFWKIRTYPYLDEYHINNKGENFEDIFKRVEKLVKLVIKKNENKNVIFVSHGDPITIYKMKLMGLKVDNESLMNEKVYIPKAGIIKIQMENNKVVEIKSINY